MKRLRHAFITVLFLMAFGFAGSTWAQETTVFETLLDPDGVAANVAQETASQLEEAGYRILTLRQAGMDEACIGEAWVVAAYQPGSADALFGLNEQTAPYALTERMVVFEDEDGTHTAMVNPESILKTVFLDSEDAVALAGSRRGQVRSVLGATSDRGYGQRRDRGLIGKTMGVMAGGSFDGKLDVLLAVNELSVQDVADRIESRFGEPDKEWGLEVAYRLDVQERDLVVFGITGDRMEAKSFSIVGAGSDRERKDLTCPGTAYAAAYPIEMVVKTVNGQTVVEAVDAMFRMKMFFEDAGKWAFMKNMGMPGSLAGEMKSRLEYAVGDAL